MEEEEEEEGVSKCISDEHAKWFACTSMVLHVPLVTTWHSLPELISI